MLFHVLKNNKLVAHEILDHISYLLKVLKMITLGDSFNALGVIGTS
jgi:hypothetical protein